VVAPLLRRPCKGRNPLPKEFIRELTQINANNTTTKEKPLLFALCSLLFALYSLLFTLYSLLFALCSLLFTLLSLLFYLL
jgi:membrane protein required for beta-lactamase induction